jgi:hypothetical protein
LIAYHLETFVGIFSRKVAIRTVYAGLLACVRGSFLDSSDGSFQLWRKASGDRVADVVAQVPWTNEEHIDAIDSGDLLDL